MREITLCADDFGMNDAIDAGILILAHGQRINATSLMTLGPTFRDNAPELRALAIGTGLHLDLTSFVPRPPASLPQLIAAAYLRRLDLNWVRSTLDKQLDVFEDVMHRRPHHVDGHRHVHQLPGVREVLVDCLRQRYGTAMPTVRATLGGCAPPRSRSWLMRGKTAMIEALGARRLAGLCQANGIPIYRRFHGIYDFGHRANAAGDTPTHTHTPLQRRFGQAMQHWLAYAQHGDVIMCHPADPATTPQLAQSPCAADPIAQDRTAEFLVLSASEFSGWLLCAGVQLARPPLLAPTGAVPGLPGDRRLPDKQRASLYGP